MPDTESRPCSCPTGSTTTRAIARRRRISRTRDASPTNWVSRFTRPASRGNIASVFSRISWPSSRPGARRIRMSFATARSSSESGSTMHDGSARSASRPATTRASGPAGGSCAGSMSTRIRAISCMRWTRSSLLSVNSRLAVSGSPRCGRLRASAACRSRRSAIRPGSASSASARLGNSSGAGWRDARARSRPRTAP